MGLFGKPREIKALDRSITAAHMVLNMYDKLPADKQERALRAAPADLRESAEKARAAGQSDAARQMLTEAKSKPMTSSVAEQWPSFIDGALAAL